MIKFEAPTSVRPQDPQPVDNKAMMAGHLGSGSLQEKADSKKFFSSLLFSPVYFKI